MVESLLIGVSDKCLLHGKGRVDERRRGRVGCKTKTSTDGCTGWAKFMMWKYPVEIRITNPTSFKVAGAVEAAASL